MTLNGLKVIQIRANDITGLHCSLVILTHVGFL